MLSQSLLHNLEHSLLFLHSGHDPPPFLILRLKDPVSYFTFVRIFPLFELHL